MWDIQKREWHSRFQKRGGKIKKTNKLDFPNDNKLNDFEVNERGLHE